MKTALVLLLLFSAALYLAINDHSRTMPGSYHSEVFGDKAGYYVYLPAAFIYHFEARAFPAHMDTMTGYGFALDTASNKVFTKYPCGTALMESPFFLGFHEWVHYNHEKADGFSDPYRFSIDTAAAFYLTLGLFLLYLFLLNYFDKRIAFLTAALVFLGSNVYYYAIHEVGMSHIYSFFLFAAYLLCVKKGLNQNRFTPARMMMLGFITAMIFLVRPINLIFCPLALLLDIKLQPRALIERVKLLLKPLSIAAFLLVFLLTIMPQLMYWHYLSGAALFYSYGNEAFIFWNKPKIFHVWFSPNNGVFLYTPLMFFMLWAAIKMMMKKQWNGGLAIMAFLAMTIAYASWWAWDLGCGYGHRAYVEYFSLFSLPIGYGIQKLYTSPVRWQRIVLLGLVFFFIVHNIKMFYSWNECWQHPDWDWHHYWEETFKGPK